MSEQSVFQARRVLSRTKRALIHIHLYAAAFLAPMVILVSISGGLYLIGIKGSVSSTPVALPAGSSIDPKSPTLDDDMRVLLEAAGVEHDFEYLKVSGDTLLTRPTSRIHYQVNVGGDTLEMQRNVPDLQHRMIELHKGHGPQLFKQFQKVMAVGLLVILISGLAMGLVAKRLRARTMGIVAAGLLIFLLLVLLA